MVNFIYLFPYAQSIKGTIIVNMFQLNKLFFLISIFLLASCSATFKNHGYTPSKLELQQLQIGKDTKQSVKSLLGPPSSLGIIHEDKWFYLSTKVKNYSFKEPEIIDRQLVAVSFTSEGSLKNIERFQLKDQKLVVLSRRITESSIKGIGLIRQIFSSAGNFDPTMMLD